jgi:hypothetical protein
MSIGKLNSLKLLELLVLDLDYGLGTRDRNTAHKSPSSLFLAPSENNTIIHLDIGLPVTTESSKTLLKSPCYLINIKLSLPFAVFRLVEDILFVRH